MEAIIDAFGTTGGERAKVDAGVGIGGDIGNDKSLLSLSPSSPSSSSPLSLLPS